MNKDNSNAIGAGIMGGHSVGCNNVSNKLKDQKVRLECLKSAICLYPCSVSSQTVLTADLLVEEAKKIYKWVSE